MFIFREFQAFMGATLPLMVKVGIIYLILRFTFAVSNVVVRLSTPRKGRLPRTSRRVPLPRRPKSPKRLKAKTEWKKANRPRSPNQQPKTSHPARLFRFFWSLSRHCRLSQERIDSAF